MTTQAAKKCRLEGCKRPYRAKGYCNVHYKKWRHGEFSRKRYKTCNAEGCRKPMLKWGLCEEHYKAKVGMTEAASVAAAPAETPPATSSSPNAAPAG